jgi:hypothetical protein
MISDTLFTARSEIEQYERDDPENLSEVIPALAKVKTVMRAMQAALDLCPVGKHRNRAWQLVGAIEALDTTALTRLLETPVAPYRQKSGQPA